MSSPVIAVKNLSKGFADGAKWNQIFDGLNLTIDHGEFVALTGHSGCGKTTLLNMIGGLDEPEKGEILVNGHDITALRGKRRADFLNQYIGFIFQSHHLLPELTALGNVMLPLRIGGKRPADASQRATELLTKLGLGGHLNAYPTTMSGGECQRVAIARALANRPQVILADEPTASLNQERKEEVLQSLIDLSKSENVTVVMVTHDKNLVESEPGRLRVDRNIYVPDLGARAGGG